MADKRQQKGILRYLKETEFKFHEEPLQNPENRFDWDFKIIARQAMTEGAQRRFADASFPPELRLEVMKASVSYHAPTFEITSESTFDDVKKAAASLFDKQHYTSDAVNTTLQQTAEQALLETCIFKVERDFESESNSNELNFTRSMAPLFDTIGAHIHFLEISVHTGRSHSGFADMEKAKKTLHEQKRRFPNLKTCILTMEIRSSSVRNGFWSRSNAPLDPYYVDEDHARFMFPRRLLDSPYGPDQDLRSVLAGMFDKFAEKGPGVRRFVRMLQVHYGQNAVYHYGPLVAVHGNGVEGGPHGISGGADIVTAAYRLRRTGRGVNDARHNAKQAPVVRLMRAMDLNT